MREIAIAFLLSVLILVPTSTRADCPVVSPIIYGGQHYDTGRVTVTASSDSITLQIFGVNGWVFDAYHVYVGTDIEQYDGQHLTPGQLPYKQEFQHPVSSYTLVVPNQWGCGRSVQIAVHTQMILPGGGREGDSRQTGWAFGEHEFSSAWGWWFDYLICCPDDTPDCTGPDGSTIPNGQSKTYYPSSSVPCGRTCVGQARECVDGVLSPSSNSYPTCSPATCRDCVMGGVTVPHGGSRIFYESSNVGCGGSCRSERRECTDGTLSGTYTNVACNVATCRDCVMGSTTIPHGQSQTFFTSSTVGCFASCSTQTRTCTDGTLSGTATATSCAPSCSGCTPPNGSPMTHGEKREFYQASSVPCGNQCNVETRECTDGVLSGSFTQLSCTPQTCPVTCTTPDGTQTQGWQKTYYESANVACGATCRSEVRTCMSTGQLSGSFTATGCSVTPCDCVMGTTTIPHGQSQKYYASSTVPCGQTCSSEMRKCTNGQLDGSFTSLTCNVDRCPCVGPNGEEMDDGATVTLAQFATVGCGQTCSYETRTCSNGNLDGSFTFRSCSVNECPKADCTAPDGTVMQHGAHDTFYSSSTVACGSTCRLETRECQDGTLTGSFTARSCSVDTCNPPPPPPPPQPTEPIPPPPTGDVCANPKAFFGEIPSLFNVFVFEDFVCRDSDTEGRIAAGGDVTITNYAVGCRLYTRENCINFGDITCSNLTAQGEWITSVVAAGNIVGQSVEVKLGNMAYGGTYNNDVTVNFQQDCDLVNQYDLVDFPAWKTYLENLSSKIANNLQKTGTVSYDANSRAVVLTGTGDSEIDVFELPASFCGSWNPSDFSIRNVASTASVFINVLGDNLDCGGFSMGEASPNAYDMHHVLFNFPQATQLTFHSIAWRGSVLAPFATITNPSSGSISGQVFAKAFLGIDTCAQQNWEPFEGCIPEYCRNVDPLPYCTATTASWAGCDSTQELTGCLPQDKYFECFSYDGVTVGCPYDGHTLTLSTIDAARTFFGQTSSTATGPLDTEYTDPASTPAGGAARELAALALAIQFDQCKSDSMGICSTFSELYVCDSESCPAFGGKTIGEIFQIANEVVGGCSSAAVTLGQVETCLRSINEAFEGCAKVTDITSQTASYGYCQCGVAVCDAMPISIRPNVNEPSDEPESGAALFAVSSWLVAILAALVLVY